MNRSLKRLSTPVVRADRSVDAECTQGKLTCEKSTREVRSQLLKMIVDSEQVRRRQISSPRV